MLLACWVGTVAGGLNSDLKCSGCSAVVDEIGEALKKEMPQQDLDLRARLNSGGERLGKVVDWKMSELRALELMDGLCEQVAEKYTVAEGSQFYSRVKAKDDIQNGKLHVNIGDDKGSTGFGDLSDMLKNLNKQMTPEGKKIKRELRVYCDSLLEEHEDEVAKSIQKVEGLRERLCVETTNMCSREQLDVVEKEADASKEKRQEKEKDADKETQEKKKKKKKKKKTKKKKAKRKKKTEL
jgi:hypothetical protein